MNVDALATLAAGVLTGSGGLAAAVYLGVRDRRLRTSQTRLTDLQADGADLANIRAMIDLYRAEADEARRRLAGAEVEIARLTALVERLRRERDSWQSLATVAEHATVRSQTLARTALDALDPSVPTPPAIEAPSPLPAAEEPLP